MRNLTRFNYMGQAPYTEFRIFPKIQRYYDKSL